MAAKVGTAYVPVEADFGPLNRAVAAHRRTLGRDADKLGTEAGERLSKAAAKGAKPVELGATLNAVDFAEYRRHLKDIRGQVSRREQFRVQLGADFDERAFRAYEKQLASIRREKQKTAQETGGGGPQLPGPEQLKKLGELAKGAIPVVALDAAVKAGVALASSLAPVAGAGAAGAQGLLAYGQAAGVAKLATLGISEALEAQIAAQDGTKESAEKAREAMEGLPKSAQDFTRELAGLQPKVEQIRKAAADGLFPGVNAGLKDAVRNLPVVERLAARTGDVLGRNAQRAGGLLGTEAFGRDLEAVGRSNALVIDRLARGGLDLGNAFRHVLVEARPLTQWLALSVTRFGHLVEKEAEAARRTGELGDFFDEARAKITRVASISQSLAAGLRAVVGAGEPLGDDLLVDIDRLAQRFEDWTESTRGQRALDDYFEDFNVADTLADVLSAAAPVIAENAGQLGLAAAKGLMQGFIDADPIGKALLIGIVGAKTGALGGLGKLLAGRAGEALKIPGIGGAGAAVRGATPANPLFVSVVGQGVPGGGAGRGAAAGAAGGAAAGAGASRIPGALRGAGALGGAVGAVAGIKVATDFFKDKSDLGLLNEYAAQLERVAKAGDAPGMTNLAAKLRETARANADITKGKHLNAFADALGKAAASGGQDLSALQAAVSRMAKSSGGDLERLRTTIGKLPTSSRAVDTAISRMATGTSGSMTSLRTNVALNTKLIERSLGKDTEAGTDALRANFRAAAANVRASMKAGTIDTKEGTAEIRRLLIDALMQVGGFTNRKQAGRYLHDRDPVTGKSMGPSGTGKARGGLVQLGRPGEGGRDSIPALLNEQPAVIARGESVAVLNRHQRPIVDQALAARGIPGLAGLFNRIRTPNYMAVGGLVGPQRRWVTGDTDFLPALMDALTRMAAEAGTPIFVQSGRRTIAEQAALFAKYGPRRAAAPSANAPHVRGIAGDITPGRERFGSLAERFGLAFRIPHEPWHVELARAVDQAVSALAGGPVTQLPVPEIRRVMARQDLGLISALSQATLDRVRGAAQARLTDVATSGANVSAGGRFSKAQLAQLWIQAGGPPDVANLMAAIALAESGGNSSIQGPVTSYGHRAGGLWQIHPPQPGWEDPLSNARMAVAKYKSQGLGAWEAYTRGMHTKYLARGGLFGPAIAALGLVTGPSGDLGIAPENRRGRRKGQTFTPRATERIKAGLTKAGIHRFVPTQFTAKLKEVASVKRFDDVGEQVTAIAQRLSNLDELFGLSDEEPTLTVPVSALTDEQLQGLGVPAGRIAELRKEDREVEIPNDEARFPGLADPATSIQRRVGELDQLLAVLGQQGHKLGEQMSTGTLADEQLMRGIGERVKGIATIRQRAIDNIAEMRVRMRAIRQHDTAVAKFEERIKREKDPKKRKALREELKTWKREHRPHHRQLTRELDAYGDQNERLIGDRKVSAKVGPAATEKLDGEPSLDGQLGALWKSRFAWEGQRDEIVEAAKQLPQDAFGLFIDSGVLLKERQALTDTPAPKIDLPDAAAAEPARDSELEGLLREQIRLANLRTAVSEAQFATLRDFRYPYGGSFAEGGIVPGPPGAPRIITAHGGEEVVRADDRGGTAVHVHFAPGTEWLRQFVRVEVEGETRRQARNAANGLPSRGGRVW